MFARKLGFKDTVIHGAYIISQFSKLIGNKLPGNGSLILFSEYKFHYPAYKNRKIVIEGKVVSWSKSTSTYNLDLVAKYKDGRIISLVMLQSEQNYEKVIITGSSSSIGRSIQKSSKTKNINFFCQLNNGNKIIKKNIKNFEADFLKKNSLDRFCKKLIAEKVTYNSLVHLPSAKLKLKRFFEYDWKEIQSQIDIQVKSIINIISSLIRSNKISDKFKIIILTSYITKNNQYPKGFTSYFLAKILLEGYIDVLKKEFANNKIKVLVIRPKIFNSPLHSNLPPIYKAKNLQKKNNELVKTTNKIINLIC